MRIVHGDENNIDVHERSIVHLYQNVPQEKRSKSLESASFQGTLMTGEWCKAQVTCVQVILLFS